MNTRKQSKGTDQPALVAVLVAPVQEVKVLIHFETVVALQDQPSTNEKLQVQKKLQFQLEITNLGDVQEERVHHRLRGNDHSGEHDVVHNVRCVCETQVSQDTKGGKHAHSAGCCS